MGVGQVADQVFLDLSKAIESQGVSRKVAADMFGLAIRTYQKKVQVSSGLVFRTGSGETSVFGVTPERDYARTVRERERESLPPILWALIYRAKGLSRQALAEKLPLESEALDEALATLEAHGQIEQSSPDGTAVYKAKHFVIPVDAEHGWEAAVLDQYQAVVRAIGRKLQQGVPRSVADDVTGGATLGFDLCQGHPHLEETLGLLKLVRTSTNELWSKVEAYNEAHPIADHELIEVTFYFGQSVVKPNE